MLSQLAKTLLTGLMVTLLPGATYAAINVDFGYFDPAPSATYGAAAGQAGVWNKVPDLGITDNLLGLSGSATTISVNVLADNNSGNAGNFEPGNDTSALRNDNFFSTPAVVLGTPWSVTFSNLDNGTYSLYYYAPENQIVVTGPFSANGVSGTDLRGNLAATLVQGQDWQVVTGITVTNGTLAINETSDSEYAGLAGLQLVKIPEPSSMPLAAGALLLLAARFRRLDRRRSAYAMSGACTAQSTGEPMCRRVLVDRVHDGARPTIGVANLKDSAANRAVVKLCSPSCQQMPAASQVRRPG
jgi:hypothetical protein